MSPQLSGLKSEKIEAVLDFLNSPEESGNAFAFKGKRKSAPKKKAAKKGKGKGKGKAAKKKRAPSAFIIFSTKMRPKVKETNPDANFGDVAVSFVLRHPFFCMALVLISLTFVFSHFSAKMRLETHARISTYVYAHSARSARCGRS
jgi:hypothetical protein